jgi:predicted dehydrogenase
VNSKIGFGIVGTGRMAALMLQALRRVEGIDVKAVMSPAPNRAREFAATHGIATAHEKLADLLNDPGITAVYVANSNGEHATTTIAALGAGKAVLCEKPFAISVAEGRAIVAAARSSGRLFMEAMWTPFLPAYQTLRRLVGEGSAGKPTHLNFEFGYPADPKSYPLLFTPITGGVVLDRAAYGISLALNLFGDVEKVDAALSIREGVDVDASLLLSHVQGGRSQLTFSMTSLLFNTATVACERGYIGLVRPTIGSEGVCVQLTQAPGGAANRQRLSFKGRLKQKLQQYPAVRRFGAARKAPGITRCSYGADPYAHQVRHFVELLHSDRVESDVNTHERSLAALEIIEAAKRGRA